LPLIRNKPLAAGAAASGGLLAAAWTAEADRRWWVLFAACIELLPG
jgi:hypothetical protein